MKLSWKDFLILHFPYVIMAVSAVICTVYAAGFEQGKRNLLRASETASTEAKMKFPQ